MDAIAASGAEEKLIFEAEIKPHRSLSAQGVWVVICCMLAGSLLVTSLMAMLGAWPVIGFNGADLALAVFLLWLNMRAARAREIITLSESRLAVTRTDVHGRRENFSMQPYWLNVVLEERAGTVPKLLFSGRGRRFEVARQLGEAEKRDLADALTRAMHRWRNPSFDNPQLR
jgi:uncharacterized membrane protein